MAADDIVVDWLCIQVPVAKETLSAAAESELHVAEACLREIAAAIETESLTDG